MDIKKHLLRLLLPVKYLLLLVSYLFPRNKKIWCFGTSFVGNTKYLFIYMNEHHKDIRCIWIANKKDYNRVKDNGFEVYTRWSFKGIWFGLIGGVYVYNSYPDNINLYTSGGARFVNLYHGIALKCIDRQIKVGPMTKIYQSRGVINELRYLNFRLLPDVVLSTSPANTKQYVEAFGVDESHFIEGLYPRCVLFNEKLDLVENFIEKYEGVKALDLARYIKRFDYSYIYMPTFRDTGDNFIIKCGFDFDRLNELMMKKNRLFIMKLHPDSTFQFKHDYSNVILIDKDIDIYPLLPFTNCLITDYSSIYCDYILMRGKQTILFIPDYNDYITKSRELAYDYDEVMKGPRVSTFEELVTLLNIENPNVIIEGLDDVRHLFWDYSVTTMSDLVGAINEKLKIRS